MYFISNSDQYYQLITRNCSTEVEKKEVIKKAYEVALETRKFEIEMYWKRATYFWAFIGAIFVAYFAILSKENLLTSLLPIAISLLGVIFSIGWYFVNRGSKLWQENWERNIEFLEEYVTGPLFKTIVVPNMDWIKLTKSYPYSVSKVNILLSLITTVFWLVILLHSLVSYCENSIHLYCVILFSCIVLLVISYQFHRWSRSFINDHLGKEKYDPSAKLYHKIDQNHTPKVNNKKRCLSFLGLFRS